MRHLARKGHGSRSTGMSCDDPPLGMGQPGGSLVLACPWPPPAWARQWCLPCLCPEVLRPRTTAASTQLVRPGERRPGESQGRQRQPATAPDRDDACDVGQSAGRRRGVDVPTRHPDEQVYQRRLPRAERRGARQITQNQSPHSLRAGRQSIWLCISVTRKRRKVERLKG